MMALKLDVLQLEEPTLEFGHTGKQIDPKLGLEQFGPLSLRFGPAHPGHVRVGLVGTQMMLDHAHRWFERCQHFLPSGLAKKLIHKDFPGFRQVFRADLDLSPGLSPSLWDFRLPDREIELALARPTPEERFNTVLNLYTAGIRELHQREQRPSVAVVCLPDEVIQRCRNVRAPRLTRHERELLRRQQLGQLALPGMEEMVGIEDTLLYRDFRRALKARAMAIGMPIQIGTDKLFIDSEANEDPASRAWNVNLALFYKAGGLPWRLSGLVPETCYVGISFHHLRTKQRHLVFSSLAQAFPTTGEGFALRGDAIPWDRDSEDRTPHLTGEQASRLAERVLEHYRLRVGTEPLRIVLYKTSKFDMAEQTGFRAALSRIPVVNLVNLRPAEFRLVRRGAYPPRRGTITVVNDGTYYLFTNGFFPDWATYMGAHVPVPYEVTTLDAMNPMDICADVLGLTKLNWNTARAFTGTPIPLRFAVEVGSIMSHYAELKGEEAEPEPSYRYYM